VCSLDENPTRSNIICFQINLINGTNNKIVDSYNNRLIVDYNSCFLITNIIDCFFFIFLNWDKLIADNFRLIFSVL